MAKELVFKLKVVNESGDVVENAAKSFEDIEKSVKSLQDELQKTDFGSDKFKQLSTELQKAEGAMEKAQNSTKSFGDKLTSIPGPIGQVAQGVKGLGTAFKALIANPVGLILAAIAAALTLLYKAFTSTKAGAEKFEQVMAGISAVIDVVRDRVLKAAGAIAKFFSGDFKGAFEDAKATVSGFGAEVAAEFQAASNATKQLQKIEDQTRSLNVERAKQNALIAEAKQQINDENLSYAQREAALEKVRQQEIALAKQEQKLAEERYKALKALADLSDSSKEQLNELAAAEAEMYNKQKETADKQKELADQAKALRDRRRAEEKTRMEEAKRLEEEKLKFLQDINLRLIKSEFERQREELKLKQKEEENQAKRFFKNEKDLKEHLEKIRQIYADAQAQVDADEAEYNATKQKEVDDQRQADADRALQERQKAYDDLIRLMNANQGQLIEGSTEFYDQQREIAKANYQKELLAAGDNATLREAAEKEYANALQAIDNTVTENKYNNLNAQLGLISSFAQNLGQLAGKNKGLAKTALLLEKGTGIASIAINTQKNAAKFGYLSPMGILELLAGASGIAAVIAATSKGINEINGAGTETSGGGGGGTSSLGRNYERGGLIGGRRHAQGGTLIEAELGEAVMTRGAVSMFGPMLSSMNQMGGGTRFNRELLSGLPDNARTTQPSVDQSRGIIKAYVVESDLTSEQHKQARLKDLSTL